MTTVVPRRQVLGRAYPWGGAGAAAAAIDVGLASPASAHPAAGRLDQPPGRPLLPVPSRCLTAYHKLQPRGHSRKGSVTPTAPTPMQVGADSVPGGRSAGITVPASRDWRSTCT